MSRGALAAVSAGVLLVLLLQSDNPGRLGRRAQALARAGRLDSNTRHLNGTVASDDRDFYVFLESARRRLPPGAPGVVIVGAPLPRSHFLAAYQFAPTPVVLAPANAPPGWLVAVYGTARPPGWKVLAPIWKGALMAPAP